MSQKREVTRTQDGMSIERVYEDEQGGRTGVTVADFYMPELVKTFKEQFRPSAKQTLQSELFTEARLREYFHAYPQSCGDPLPLYIEELTRAGFLYQCHPLLGRAVIMADYIYI